MKNLALCVLILGLGVVSCAKRPVVLVDPAFDGKSVRDGPAALVLADKVDVKDVVQELVANFQGDPETAVRLVRETLLGVLAGKEACLSMGEFGSTGGGLFNFRGIDGAAWRDSLLACVQTTRDEYGVTRAATTDPQTLASLLSAHGFRHLVLMEQTTLGRGVSERGNVLTGSMVLDEVTLSSQVLIWSVQSKSWVYSGYVNGTRSGKKIDRGVIKDLVCFLGNDLYQALR
jgi:hypothetical protein